MERLQKIMAAAGVASRRKCEEYITSGRVTVNGERIMTLGSKATESDDIRVDGQKISVGKKIYIALHKPAGYECTAAETKRRTVFDLVRVPDRLFYVGRLDYETEGLILLTNDGAFAQQMSHPRYEKEKVYLVTVKGRLAGSDIETLGRGLKIKALNGEVDTGSFVNIWPVKVKVISEGKYSTYEFAIHEGRKNIIRRVVAHLGKEVERLRRVRIGTLTIGGLDPGKWRHLRAEEVESLLAETKERPKAKPLTTTMEAREFKREWNPVGTREQRKSKFTEKELPRALSPRERRIQREARFAPTPTERIEREPASFGREPPRHIDTRNDGPRGTFVRGNDYGRDRADRASDHRTTERFTRRPAPKPVWKNPNHGTPARTRGQRPEWRPTPRRPSPFGQRDEGRRDQPSRFNRDSQDNRAPPRSQETPQRAYGDYGRDRPARHDRGDREEREFQESFMRTPKKPFKYEKRETRAEMPTGASSIDTSPPPKPSHFGGDYDAWRAKRQMRPAKNRYSRRRTTA